MVESTFEVDDISIYKRICGFNDRNVKKIEQIIGASIIPRGNTLIVKSTKEKNECTL
jgi:phosphate starvation-inducible protein PhoH